MSPPWEVVARYRELGFPYPLILAGGLTPDNVATGISRVGPDAVDVSSGVEGEPGQKDPRLVRDFIERANAAFA
jgi:phosphoribosylanthranilate isomerase